MMSGRRHRWLMSLAACGAALEAAAGDDANAKVACNMTEHGWRESRTFGCANNSAREREYVSLAAPPRCPSKVCSFAAMDKCRRKRCLACGSGRGPVLFADLYVDGVGVTVGLGIGKVAFAHGRNFSFGGLVHKVPLSKTSPGQHGVIQAWALQAIFGATVTVLPDAVKGLNVTPAANATARGREHVYVKDKHVPSGGGPGFVTALRAGARCFLDAYAARLVFRPKRLRVALHLRRGDIDEHTQTSIRWVTAECVTRTLGAIRALAPSADFHVFSSVAIYPRRKVWVSKDFDPIRRWGATVHLDHETHRNDDSTDAALLHWANWISTDVFLTGSSGVGKSVIVSNLLGQRQDGPRIAHQIFS